MKKALRARTSSGSLLEKASYRGTIDLKQSSPDEELCAAAERHYSLIRAWVMHNEAHRRMVGTDAKPIQASLMEFSELWRAL